MGGNLLPKNGSKSKRSANAPRLTMYFNGLDQNCASVKAKAPAPPWMTA